jgi:hypothetical protein
MSHLYEHVRILFLVRRMITWGIWYVSMLFDLERWWTNLSTCADLHCIFVKALHLITSPKCKAWCFWSSTNFGPRKFINFVFKSHGFGWRPSAVKQRWWCPTSLSSRDDCWPCFLTMFDHVFWWLLIMLFDDVWLCVFGRLLNKFFRISPRCFCIHFSI